MLFCKGGGCHVRGQVTLHKRNVTVDCSKHWAGQMHAGNVQNTPQHQCCSCFRELGFWRLPG